METRIISELSECREDERNTQNRILQVIGIAGTLLGVLFALSSNDYFGSNDKVIAMYSIISDIIFLGAFTFVTTLAFECAFRYHYIRDLERRLRTLMNKCKTKPDKSEDFVNWVEVISPVTTKNITHLKHGFSIMYFFLFFVSMLSAMGFGVCITYSLYKQAYDYAMVRIGFYSLVFLGSVLIIVFFVGSMVSKNIYEYSKKKTLERVTFEK